MCLSRAGRQGLLFFVFGTSLFLVLYDVPGLVCIFPASALESTVSPKSPGSFYWETVLETKMWVLSMLIAVEVSSLLGPLV